MNHEEKGCNENDESDRLVIDSDDDTDSQSPVLETLVLKKGPNGYTVQKGRKIKRPSRNETTQDRQKTIPSNKPLFYVFPVPRNQPLTHEELSSLYTKYIEKSSYFANTLQNIVLSQGKNISQSSESNLNHLTNWQVQNNSEASSSKDNSETGALLENADQDPVIDSTNQEYNDEPSQSDEVLYHGFSLTQGFNSAEIENNSVIMEDDLRFILPNEMIDLNLATMTPPSSLEYSNLQGEKTPKSHEFEFIEVENHKPEYDFEDRQNSQLDPLYGDRVLGGSSLVKKDCFLAEKMKHFSGLDGFNFANQNIVRPENMEITFEEPMLEKLFSQVSDASQASTKTADPDEMGFLDTEDEDESGLQKKRPPAWEENINILEDGSIPVISRSDSDVYIVGSN